MSEQSPAAWHPDPYGRHERRYWDGKRWTEHVASGGQQGVDPQVDGPPTPTTSASANTVPNTLAPADWYPDPLRRYERRYWDGTRWTDHVATRGHHGIDSSVSQTAEPGANRPNKKVEKQVRKAGAASSGAAQPGAARARAGGGTLFTEDVLVVNQKAKLFGSTLGYAVYSQHGHQLGTIQELRRDLGTKMSDNLRMRGESNRTYRFQVLDMNNRVVLAMTRPEKWFTSKSKMIVEGVGGVPIGQLIQETTGLVGGAATLAHVGLTNVSTIAQYNLGFITSAIAGPALDSVQRRLSSAVEGLDQVGHVRFGIEAADGQQLGSIHAESLKEWNFHIQDPAGTTIVTITKTWAGWTKERFTKTDNYVVQMHQPLTDPLHSLVIATALVLDVALKQGDPTYGSRRNRGYN